MLDRPAAVLIAGPTAAGKSDLAIRLATRLGGVIINADSMQVYRDLRIITARPGPAEEAKAPHALFGTVDAAETYSVSRWLADVAGHLAATRGAGLLPILVGGTGLYFKALTQGLSDIPPVPDEVRSAVRARAFGRPAADLHADLTAVDPLAAARLLPTDTQRILRALEVQAATGRSLLHYQNSRSRPLLEIGHCACVFLTMERPALRERIDRRFDAMMADGALEEIAALAARQLAPDLPLSRALGVAPLIEHVRGRIGLAEAIAVGKADTRRYIKRQETFARHQLPHFRFVPRDAAEAFVMQSFDLKRTSRCRGDSLSSSPPL